jgi:hypothetical protein
LLNGLVHYFSLAKPVLGKTGVRYEIVLYTGVLAGAAGQWLFAAFRSGDFAWAGLVLGVIASIVVFPAIYYNAGLNKGSFTFVKWCVAFQNGFFWPSLLEQVGRGFQSS